MAEHTSISWTQSTVNFWWGCTAVGPGCDHCYAEAWAKRTGHQIWGTGAPRRKIASAADTMSRLNKAGAHYYPSYRRRVFVQSMSDLFDLEVPVEWFKEAWQSIDACPNLSIQIVTKRISAVEKRLAAIGSPLWPSHAGLICTVVNQDEADRDVPRLLALKEKLGIPWIGLSIEPMLGRIDLTGICTGHYFINALSGQKYHDAPDGTRTPVAVSPALDWIIVGGESGAKARPMELAWARAVRDDCIMFGVPFHFKQWGEWLPFGQEAARLASGTVKERAGSGRTIGTATNKLCSRVGKARAGRLLDGKIYNDFVGWPHG